VPSLFSFRIRLQWHLNCRCESCSSIHTYCIALCCSAQTSLGAETAAWLIGAPSCKGTLAERANSGRPECSEALLVKWASFVTRQFVVEGLNGHFEEDFPGRCCEDHSEGGFVHVQTLADSVTPMTDAMIGEVRSMCEAECTADCACTLLPSAPL